VAARRHVDVLVVEEDPRFGLLGGRLALVGLLLHEPADCLGGGVDRFVELPVDMDWIGHTVAAHRGRIRLSGGAGPRRQKNDDEGDGIELQNQSLTDARPASRISCDSARSSTARAMTMAPTNVAYVAMAFCLLAAFDLRGTSFARRSQAART